MRIIAHRANLYGPNPATENTIAAIDRCRFFGFDAEIDVYAIDGTLRLGHDKTTIPLNVEYLLANQDWLWIHAKNIKAAELLALTSLHWFWHEQDTMTLTSRGVIWCHHTFIIDGITVLHSADELNHIVPNVGGICTDYPELAQKILKH